MRRVPLLAVVVLALVAGLTAPAAGQEVDRAPTLTVTPSSDLVDGQAVIVEGDGWWPESRPILEECEVGTGRCALQWVRVDVDASGHFAVERIARAAFTSDDNGGEVDCLVSTCAFHIDFIAVVDAPIAFDPDAPLLPPPTITVTPDHDLVDGDVMVVEGTGFSEGDGVDYASGGGRFFGSTFDPSGLYRMLQVLEWMDELGLSTALGWYATKHAIGLYGNRPPERPFAALEPAPEPVAPRAVAPRAVAAPADAEGQAETGTLIYDRDGAPSYGILFALLDDGRRALGHTNDAAVMAAMAGDDFLGSRVRLAADRSFAPA